MNIDSQRLKILAYLKRGHVLTPIEALHKFGSLRLAARICELRESGHNIGTEVIRVRNGKRVACYFMRQA